MAVIIHETCLLTAVQVNSTVYTYDALRDYITPTLAWQWLLSTDSQQCKATAVTCRCSSGTQVSTNWPLTADSVLLAHFINVACIIWSKITSWARDVNSRDRDVNLPRPRRCCWTRPRRCHFLSDETETLLLDETETLSFFVGRDRDVVVGWDRDVVIFCRTRPRRWWSRPSRDREHIHAY